MSEISAGAANAPAVSFAPETAPHRNPAVQRCLDAPYRQAMPDPIGLQNIQYFIACVSQGLLIGAIQESNASRLLYAAQVASTVLAREPRTPGRPPTKPPLPETRFGDAQTHTAPAPVACLPENEYPHPLPSSR
jgi:hypothetical protein